MKKNLIDGDIIMYLQKLKRIMRLSLFLIVLSSTVAFSSNTYSQSTKLSLKVENRTVKEIISEIEENSEFIFFYQKQDIDLGRKVSLHVEKEDIKSILTQLFAGTDNVFVVNNRQVVIGKAPLDLDNIKLDVYPVSQPQQKEINGKVTDPEGVPIPGLSVIVKGTTVGTVTDVNGSFSLRIPVDAETLQFSFVGMKTQEVPVAGKSTFNVKMESEVFGLDEIIAVGYGTMKKSDITGSISSVPMEHIKNQPVRSLSDMLSGRVAGVTLTRTSGDLGTPSKIRVRGPNSIDGDNSPLTVVDGVIGASMGPAMDVESIEILKDASATAIYGERASNGVILITTKKASAGEPKIRISLNTGFSKQKIDYPDFISAGDYAEFVNDLKQSEVFTAAEIAEFRETGGTKWLDAVTQTGIKNTHYISYSQMVNKFSVYLSGQYSDEKGTMINTSSGGNYNVRSNVGFQPNDRLKMNLDLKANKWQTKNGGLSTGTSKGHPFFQSLIWSPTEPIWEDEENGVYNKYDSYGGLMENPYMTAKEQDNFSLGSGIHAIFTANYKLFDFLSYDVTGYASQSSNQEGTYKNIYLDSNDPNATREGYESSSWRLINKLDFNKTFNDAHTIAATAVYEAEASESWKVSGTGRKMPLPDLASYYSIGLSNEQSASSEYGKSSRVAYMGRLNYNYKSRYYFTASYRVDGKSGPKGRVAENVYGGFPSFAASWRLSEEPFMQGNGIFDNLKFRLGWGQTGNPAGYQYTTMTSNNWDYGIDSDILGYIPGTPANPNVKWETTTQKDFGVDFSVLDGKLSATFDYFNKRTKDLLTSVELPLYLGYGQTSYKQNLGEISNKGIEFTIDYVPVQTRNFYWNVNMNFSRVKNKVLDLGEQAAYLTGTDGNSFVEVKTYRVMENMPLGTMWGYKWLGIWQESEAAEAAKYGCIPGDYKYEDVNNDGGINIEDDGQAIGDANPDFTWGLNNSFSYKNFDFSILLQGMHGQDVYNLARAAMATVHADSRTIMLTEPAMNYWTPENPDSEWRNIHATSNSKALNSTKWIENGSWVKVKYVNLTYNLPKDLLKFGTLALSVSAEELITFTKYKGLDPEVSSSGTDEDVWGGCDFGTQPVPTTVTFGVSLDF